MPRTPRAPELPEVDLETLSAQQLVIYLLAKRGKTASDIANLLGTSRRVVDEQIARIRRKAEGKTIHFHCTSDLGLDKPLLRKKFATVRDVAALLGTAGSVKAGPRPPTPAHARPGPVTRYRIPRGQLGRIPVEKPAVDPSASFCYRVLVSEARDPRRDEIRLMGLGTNLGGWRSKRLVIRARSSALHDLARRGRRTLMRSTPELLGICGDVVDMRFKKVEEDLFEPTSSTSWRDLEAVLSARARELLDGAVGKTGDGPDGLPVYRLIPERTQGLVLRPTVPGALDTEAGVRKEQGPPPKPKGTDARRLIGTVEKISPGGTVTVSGRTVRPDRVIFRVPKRGWWSAKDARAVLRQGDAVEVRDGALVVKAWGSAPPHLFAPDARVLAALAARYVVGENCVVVVGRAAYRFTDVASGRRAERAA